MIVLYESIVGSFLSKYNQGEFTEALHMLVRTCRIYLPKLL